MNAKKANHNIRHLRVHSVLYGNDPERIEQTVAHLNRAADLAISGGAAASVSLTYGDSSPSPVLSSDFLDRVRANSPALRSVDYVHFDGNLGSAKGHNTLIDDAESKAREGVELDAILIMNPDVMLAPDTLIELLRPTSNPRVGMVEARQLPIEHPKEYDRSSGETSWATTACALIPIKVLRELNGFDNESFFLYCDDVDFSWRARLAGYQVIYQPSAVVFHDKRLSKNGQWAPTASEQYYSAEAALIMAHKYSRPDIAEKLFKSFSESDTPHLKRAAAEYAERKASNRLPTPIDPEGRVAEFLGDHYTKHRYAL
ncbi:glycosyltransferase family 2 protein [Dyella sedimenti]|uniref:glycosyltransferase family 2 protein n=1 Tax=Dyella sedimenti TaxID=2919947 RepID=UPI001FAA0CCB|nr:glycosyltransferase family 2 protein [Dyella sedimenti]